MYSGAITAGPDDRTSGFERSEFTGQHSGTIFKTLREALLLPAAAKRRDSKKNLFFFFGVRKGVVPVPITWALSAMGGTRRGAMPHCSGYETSGLHQSPRSYNYLLR